MAELKSLGTIFPNLLVTDGGGLIETFARLSTWFEATFPTLNTDAETEAWLLQYGSLVDTLCSADGSNGSISSGTPLQTRTVLGVAKNALLQNNASFKTGLHALTASNPFRGKDATETYERLLKVVSSMYFAVEVKTRK